MGYRGNYYFASMFSTMPTGLELDVPITKKCSKCRGDFITRSRRKEVCDACHPAAAREKKQKANARMRAKRVKKREVLAAAG